MPTGSPILQSGAVTPNHLAAFVTDGVVADAGVAFAQSFGILATTVLNINFNAANVDNVIPIPLPLGYTRYRISGIHIAGASGTLTTATCGVFTAVSGGGLAVVTGGTALTINTSVADTNNNAQSLTVVNQNTLALSDPVLYFRLQNAQGSAATANLTLFYQPLP